MTRFKHIHTCQANWPHIFRKLNGILQLDQRHIVIARIGVVPFFILVVYVNFFHVKFLFVGVSLVHFVLSSVQRYLSALSANAMSGRYDEGGTDYWSTTEHVRVIHDEDCPRPRVRNRILTTDNSSDPWTSSLRALPTVRVIWNQRIVFLLEGKWLGLDWLILDSSISSKLFFLEDHPLLIQCYYWMKPKMTLTGPLVRTV